MEKYAISGASKYGKTTVINELARRGYEICPEAARDIILKHKQINGVDPRENDLELTQKQIINEQIRRESLLKGPVSFTDRSLLDALAYCETKGIQLHVEYIETCNSAKYDKIFILEETAIAREENDEDDIRKSTPEERRKFQNILRQMYEERGFKVISVPEMPTIEDRVNFILNHI